VRGASALQEALTEKAKLPLRVFVVWEPVLVTDIAPPTTRTLGLIHDSRAAQYWDRERVLSEDIVRALRADPSRYPVGDELEKVDEETIVWDFIALFPRGVLWERDIPVPVFHGFPVVRSIAGLRQGLASASQR